MMMMLPSALLSCSRLYNLVAWFGYIGDMVTMWTAVTGTWSHVQLHGPGHCPRNVPLTPVHCYTGPSPIPASVQAYVKLFCEIFICLCLCFTSFSPPLI